MTRSEDILKIAKLAIETARDVEFLLDRCPDLTSRQMGDTVQHPTAKERAAELHTTLRDTRQYFGLNPDPDSGEAL